MIRRFKLHTRSLFGMLNSFASIQEVFGKKFADDPALLARSRNTKQEIVKAIQTVWKEHIIPFLADVVSYPCQRAPLSFMELILM